MMSLDRLRARFARNEGLPFADVLTEASIRDALNQHDVQYRDRVFGPVTTLWGFLKDNRAEQFKVITTILDASIDGGQIDDLYERRWSGEVDIRSIKSVMQMDILRCKTPEMVRKEIWAHLLAYNLLRTVMAVAAGENGLEPRQVSFKGAKQAVTAFTPKIESARPEDRPALVEALLTVIAYQRVGDRPGRWEPRARKRRPKPGARLNQPREQARLPKNRRKWF